MTRRKAIEAARIAGRMHVRASVPSSSHYGSRWGLWLFAVLVAGGAASIVTLTGADSAGKQVPAVIQIGRPAITIVTAPPTSTVPRTTVAPPTSTTTVPVAKPLTTVVLPLSKVSDHEDTGGVDNSKPTIQSGTPSTSIPD